jgi:lipopolysaccharide transport system ATP-binding protein
MTDIAIKVERLSKLYRIGSRQPGYQTLRESIVNATTSSIRRLSSLFRPVPSFPSANSSSTGLRSSVSGPDNHIWALKDVSFEVEQGEVVGIIGRNGAGKSTLLKILSRISEPTEGYAEIQGRISSLLEVGTGFHPELTGRENIYLNGAILGMRRAEIQTKFDEIVAFAEVEKFIDTPVKHYSSGMYLRLAFAVAAHLEPDILLVDEVLAVGDIGFQNKCLKKMQNVSEGGRTVLFVSHNMGAIQRLCHRCILLDEGKIVLEGPTGDVIKFYVSKGIMNRTEYIQACNPEKPINLRAVRLETCRGEARSEFPYDEEFQIAIEYEVNHPISNCMVWAGIRTPEEVWILGTTDCDVDASMLGQREVGYYRTAVRVPGKWLNGGRYSVVAGIMKNGPVVSYDRVEAVNFMVLDVNTPGRLRSGQNRLGILQPFLGWNTEKEYFSSHDSVVR